MENLKKVKTKKVEDYSNVKKVVLAHHKQAVDLKNRMQVPLDRGKNCWVI